MERYRTLPNFLRTPLPELVRLLGPRVTPEALTNFMLRVVRDHRQFRPHWTPREKRRAALLLMRPVAGVLSSRV